MARNRRSRRRPLSGAAKRSHDQKQRHGIEQAQPSSAWASPNDKDRCHIRQPASTSTDPQSPPPTASNLSRQEGHRHQVIQRAQNRAVAPFIPGPLEVYPLLAFMQHMQTQGHPHRYRYPLGSSPLLQDNPSRPKRSLKLLDALASICVSRAHGDSVATAIRFHETDRRVVLYIATNGDIPQTTIDHVENVWNILKKIMAHARELSSNAALTNTPPLSKWDANVQSLLFRLVTEVIRFTFLKLEKRVLSKINKLRSISLSDLRDDHPWHRVRAHIESLAANISRIRHDRDNNNLLLTDEDCAKLRKDLGNLQLAVDGLFGNRSDEEPPLSTDHREVFLIYKEYLRKIIYPTSSSQTLVAAAMSPDCRTVFTADLEIEALQTEETQIGRLPGSVDEWRDQLRLPMKYYNYIHHPSPSLILDYEKSTEDCEKVHQGHLAPHQSSRIHCEVKLLLRLYNDRQTNPQLPPAFSYWKLETVLHSMLIVYGMLQQDDGGSFFHQRENSSRQGQLLAMGLSWQLPSPRRNLPATLRSYL